MRFNWAAFYRNKRHHHRGGGAGSPAAAAASGAGLVLFGAEVSGFGADFIAATPDMFIRGGGLDYSGNPFSKFTFTRAGVAYYFNSAGLLTAAAVDVPRYDYDPVTLTRRGVLVEGAATNVVLRSDDMSNAAWTKSNITAAKTQTGPSGVVNSATLLTATAGNGTCLQAITLAESARLQSAYIKRITGTGTIEMTTDGGSTWTAVVPTSAWTRVTIPKQTLADPSVGFRIVTSGDAIAVMGVQNEEATYGSPFHTSYIPTTTVAVTRAADLMSLATSAFPYSASQGTIIADWEIPAGSAYDTVIFLTSVDPPDYNDDIELQGGDPATVVVASGGVVDYASGLEGVGLLDGSPNKVGFAYKVNDLALVSNGGVVDTDTVAVMPAPAIIMYIGNGSDPAGIHLNGWMRKLLYVPRRMANAELAARTT